MVVKLRGRDLGSEIGVTKVVLPFGEFGMENGGLEAFGVFSKVGMRLQKRGRTTTVVFWGDFLCFLDI
jgi:hypothetical protein